MHSCRLRHEEQSFYGLHAPGILRLTPGAPEGKVWNVLEYSQVRYRGKAYDEPSSNL